MAIYRLSRRELKNKRAVEFKEGDAIRVGKYLITISYKSKRGGTYEFPLASRVENIMTGKPLDCTPGVVGGWPYYIADFM